MSVPYSQLRARCLDLKSQGLTNLPCNSSRRGLEHELNRIDSGQSKRSASKKSQKATKKTTAASRGAKPTATAAKASKTVAAVKSGSKSKKDAPVVRLVEEAFVQPADLAQRSIEERTVLKHEPTAWLIFKDRLPLVSKIQDAVGGELSNLTTWEAIWQEIDGSVVKFYGSSARFFGPDWDVFHAIAQEVLGDDYPTDDNWAHYANKVDLDTTIKEQLTKIKEGTVKRVGFDSLSITNLPIISTVLATINEPFRKLAIASGNGLWLDFVELTPRQKATLRRYVPSGNKELLEKLSNKKE